jgi:hypothetical protein
MTSEQLTAVATDTDPAASAEKGLLIVILMLVLMGVGGMLFMV